MKVRVVAIAISLGIGLTAVAQGVSGASAPHVASRTTTFQKGMDTLVDDGCQDPATWKRFATAEAQAFKKLGANSVGVTFPFYTDSSTANTF